MTNQRTPGPWWHQGGLTEEEAGVAGGRPPSIIHIIEDGDEDGPGEDLDVIDEARDPDYALMAASPELLEACQKALTCRASMNPDVVQLIENAIAKAAWRW